MGIMFTGEFKVSYYAVDTKQRLRPSGLVAYFQDLAIDHADFLGYTIDCLQKENKGWVVTNWDIVIVDRMPRCGEKIKIETWSGECRRKMAQRYFIVKDIDGHILCKAASRWVFMDLKLRIPTDISDEMGQAFVYDYPSPLEGRRFLMPKAEDTKPDAVRKIQVMRSETDTNGHANNVKYIEWAMDQVPDEVYDSYRMIGLKVAYKKECMRGTEIDSETYVIKGDQETEVISYFRGPETLTYAQVASVWSPLFDGKEQ